MSFVDNNIESDRPQKSVRAFTLIEILLVVAALAMLIAVTLPISLDFYKSQQLDVHTREIIQSLRRAQLKAMSIQDDASFGVYLTDDNYTLFKGDSYETRKIQHDEVFDLPQVIGLTGLSEVIFLKSEGTPSTIGTIIVTNNIKTNIISINGVGRVNLEL